jgi:PA-IL-like protein
MRAVSCTSPGGAVWEWTRAVLRMSLVGMLIGRICNGPWFAIGSKGELTPRQSWRLYLLYNDVANASGDNSGEHAVEIMVTSS